MARNTRTFLRVSGSKQKRKNSVFFFNPIFWTTTGTVRNNSIRIFTYVYTVVIRVHVPQCHFGIRNSNIHDVRTVRTEYNMQCTVSWGGLFTKNKLVNNIITVCSGRIAYCLQNSMHNHHLWSKSNLPSPLFSVVSCFTMSLFSEVWNTFISRKTNVFGATLLSAALVTTLTNCSCLQLQQWFTKPSNLFLLYLSAEAIFFLLFITHGMLR